MNYQKIKSFLWNKRGNLNCYICHAKNSVISGPYKDSLGYTYLFECIKCGNPMSDTMLAKYNGLKIGE